MTNLKIVVCGTGNTAHVIAGLAGAEPGVDVTIYTINAEKARTWKTMLQKGPLTVKIKEGNEEKVVTETNSIILTSDPAEAARNCDMLIVSLPAFAHKAYLEKLAPYLEDGVIVAGMPGQSGFEWEVNKVFQFRNLPVMNFDSSPWACRIESFGSAVTILGVKEKLVGAIQGFRQSSKVAQPFEVISKLFGQWTKIVETSSMLAISLIAINGFSHPAIMYGAWKDWNGLPLPEPPLFYNSVSPATAQLLMDVMNEGIRIKEMIQHKFPGEDLSEFVSLQEWDLTRYSHLIGDTSDFFSATRTNAAYANILHPMIQTERGYIPDFESRYLSEDVPYGLLSVRGMAELADVPTPKMDEVLYWCQKQLGREYLVNGKLTGKDIEFTRTPQRYGYHALNEFLCLSCTQ